MEATVAQESGLRHRDVRRPHAFGGASVARRTHDRRAPVDAREPGLRFTPAFADEREHDRVGARTRGDLFEQRRFAGSGCTEKADARAAADRKQTVDNGHARPKRRSDRLTLARRRRAARRDGARPRGNRTSAVECDSRCIERAPERGEAERRA